MRVENDSDKAAPATNGYSIKDTQGNVYKPIAMGPKNVFAYRPAVLQPKDILPLPEQPGGREHDPGLDAAVQDPGGATSRTGPLELADPPPQGGGPTGTVDLDV